MPPDELPAVPRRLEKYRRRPSGEKAGPVISEPDWPSMRRKGAMTSSGVMTQISSSGDLFVAVDRAGGGRVLLKTRHRQQSLDHPGQPVGLGHGGGEAAPAARGHARLQVLQP